MREPAEADWKARADVLEQENQRLRDELESIKELLLLSTSGVPSLFGLTPSEHIVLGALFRRTTLTRAAIHDLLYSTRVDQETPELKIVDVFVCKLRRKVSPLGIEIKTNWGQGYTLPLESRKRISQIVNDWKQLHEAVSEPGDVAV